MRQGKLPPAIAGQQGHIIQGKDVGVLRWGPPGLSIKNPEVRAELGVLVKEQEDLRGRKGATRSTHWMVA